MLITLVVALPILLLEQPQGTRQLPIPFPQPESAYVCSRMVRAEKLLAKSNFTGAARVISMLSVNEVRWSVDASQVPAVDRQKCTAAAVAGVKAWVVGLQGVVVFRRADANPNVRIVLMRGYSLPPNGVNTIETGPQGCEEFELNLDPASPRVMTARVYVDRGPDGAPHQAEEISHLAGRAVGAFLGLRPLQTASGVMGRCLHSGSAPTGPADFEIQAVREIAKAAASIASSAKQKRDVTYRYPEITMEPDAVELGPRNADVNFETEMKFRNTGTAPLHVVGVHSECKCVGTTSDTDVKPGEIGTLKLTIIPLNMLGTTTKHVVIESNDLETPNKLVTIKLIAVKNAAVEPTSGTMDLPIARDATHQFFIYSPTGEAFHVLRVECADKRVAMSFVEGKQTFAPATFPNLKSEERSGWVVTVKIPAAFPIGGPTTLKIAVATDANRTRAFFYELTVTKGIRVTPAITYMSVVHDPTNDSTLDQRSAMVESVTQSFEIAGIDLAVDGLTTKVETVEVGHKYRVWFIPKPGLVEGAFSVPVTIRTDSKEQPALKTTVWVSVEKPLG